MLLAQFTTDGELSGNMQVQVFPQGDNENFLVLDLPLGVGVGCPTGGGGDNCLYEDALGDCGGDCDADADADGICDDIDDCVGTFDECGVCMVRAPSTTAAVLRFQRVIAIVMAMWPMPSACVAANVRPTRMQTGFATMWMSASAWWTNAGCATWRHL